MKFRFFILSVALLSTGCTFANLTSINRQFTPDTGDSRLIDAKQRAIVAVRKPLYAVSGQKIGSVPNVCAEPSPDALQAVAATLSGSGAFSKGDIEAALKGTFNTGDSASSIGLRTQSIQLLRDAYYRLCEAHLNDGIDSIAYDVMQRRFQNQIIALLAVEQLTGTVTAAQARVSTSSAADAGADTALLANQIRAERTEKRRIEDERTEAQAQLEILEVSAATTESQATAAEKIISDKKAKEEAPTAAETNQATELRKQADNEAKLLAAQAKRTRDLAEDVAFQDQLIAQLSAGLAAAGQKTLNSSTEGLAGLSGQATVSNANLSSDVTQAVRAITLNAINQDYDQQVCFESLRLRNHTTAIKNLEGLFKVQRDFQELSKDQVFYNYCKNLLNARTSQVEFQFRAQEQKNDILHAAVTTFREGKTSAADLTAIMLTVDRIIPADPTTRFLVDKIDLDFANKRIEVETKSKRAAPARSAKIKSNDLKAVEKELADLRAQLSAQVAGVASVEPLPNGVQVGGEVRIPVASTLQTRLGTPIISPACPQGTEQVGEQCLTACMPGEQRSGTQCLSLCGDGTTFDAEKKQCVPAPPAD